MNAWVWDRPYRKGPTSLRQGSAATVTSDPQVVQVKHVVGFARPNWGEGNWTAKDLR